MIYFYIASIFQKSIYDDNTQLRRMMANDVMSLEYRQDKRHPLGDRYVAGQRVGFGPKGWNSFKTTLRLLQEDYIQSLIILMVNLSLRQPYFIWL